jgi:hypothetical protein
MIYNYYYLIQNAQSHHIFPFIKCPRNKENQFGLYYI